MDSLALSIGKDTVLAAVSFGSLYGLFYAIGARQERHLKRLIEPITKQLQAIEEARARDSDRVNKQLQEIRHDFAVADREVRDDSGAARAAIRSEIVDLVKLIREDVAETRTMMISLLRERNRAAEK